MASIWQDERTPFLIACITAFKGTRRVQLKKSTGVHESAGGRREAMKIAERIADELEQAAQGKRTPLAVKDFLSGIEDMRTRRVAGRSFDAVLKATGNGNVKTSVRVYAARWLDSLQAGVAASTFSTYRNTMTRFLGHLGARADEDLNELEKADLLRFRDAELARVSDATVRVMLKVLRMMLAQAESDGCLARSIARARDMKIKERKQDKAARRPFTVPELKALLDVADAEWRAMILTGLYGGGMRLGDVAALTWQNVDLAGRMLTYTARKTGRVQRVPLAEPLQRALMELAASDDPRAPLFPKAHTALADAADGRAVTLSGQFSALLAAAGLAKAEPHKAKPDGKGRAARRRTSELGFHALRHTAVSMFKKLGVPVSVVMDIAGHESEAMSAHYTHTDDKQKADAVAKLARLVKL